MPAMNRWKVPGLAFMAGTAIGGVILNYDIKGFVAWLVGPGLWLSLPVLYLTPGGVHSDYSYIWAWSIAPLNGVAYALVPLIFRRLKNFYKNYKKPSI